MGTKILYGLGFLCIAFTFSVLGLLGWLGASGRLNGQSLARLFHGETVKQEEATTQPTAATQPTAGSDEQVTMNESANELANLMMDRRMKELGYQAEALRTLQDSVAQQREELRLAKLNFLKEYQQNRQLQEQDGFKGQVKLYESMQPKQVKEILMGMDEALAAQYLTSMNKRTASRIVSEFKTADEKTRLQRLLERMRSEG